MLLHEDSGLETQQSPQSPCCLLPWPALRRPACRPRRCGQPAPGESADSNGNAQQLAQAIAGKPAPTNCKCFFPCRRWPAGECSPAAVPVDRHDSPAGWLLQGQGEQGVHRQRAFVFVGAGLPANLRLRQCPLIATILLQAGSYKGETPCWARTDPAPQGGGSVLGTQGTEAARASRAMWRPSRQRSSNQASTPVAINQPDT